ncbi:hypothetical protein N2603_19395 [Bradyrhizobium huanghuaihaiense]|nr:hypothetical protein [Bradyrhizobium sp. CB3035]UWU80547.1 hypothetical protein N2603_19395 [Bradyrhizobium sp. CB3035]
MVIDLRDGIRPVSLSLGQNATREAMRSLEETGARLRDPPSK